MSSLRIGIDLGGTKIEVIALGEDHLVRARYRVATPRHDYTGTLRTIADLVAQVETETAERGAVGVGTPGSLSPFTGRMRNANSVWLNGKPLDRDLAEALGRPVRLSNDADCFALSETVDGAGAGAHSVFGVITVDPDVIVLGGGLSKLQRLYRQVPKLMGDYLFSDGASVDLRPPVHGDSGGVRGAAWLW